MFGRTKVTLTLGRLLGEDVALVGVASLVLAGSGLPEALGRARWVLILGIAGSLRLRVTDGGGSLAPEDAATLSIHAHVGW
jgi:hypothetical protein